MQPQIFQDRRDAGQQLAKRLGSYADRPDVIILALPRGGVPVAFEVAKALCVPLDVFVVRKLGVPGHPELAMGAISTGGGYYLNESIIRQLGITRSMIADTVASETAELERREELYRGGRPRLNLKAKTVIVVDDGLATGASMLAAVQAIQSKEPARLVVAVPVAAASSRRELEADVDEFVCVTSPEYFQAVGLWYADFGQTTDEEVRLLLSAANPSAPSPIQERLKWKTPRSL